MNYAESCKLQVQSSKLKTKNIKKKVFKGDIMKFLFGVKMDKTNAQ